MPRSASESISRIDTVVAVTTALTATLAYVVIDFQKRRKWNKRQATVITCSRAQSYSYTYHRQEDLIGNTPLLRLEKLSRCLFQQNGKRGGGGKQSFHVKMECSNPNGTGKDRAALFMLRKAEERGDLPHPSNISKVIDWNHGKHPQANAKAKDLSSNHHTTETFQDNDDDDDDETNLMEKTIANATLRTKTGGIVVEGTSGSTGISLATLATQRGHSTIIVMPDDQAMEKQSILKCLGAVVHIVPNAAISNPNHYVNVARRIAMEINKKQIVMDGNGGGEVVVVIQAAFMNQFENLANYHAHYSTTGPEIWDQTNGCVDLFCMSSGTGGTISGSGRYLKDSYQKFHPNKTPCRVVLVDPPGSALYNKVKYNVAYASEQQERGLKRHRYDTLAEGIGLDRITQNFTQGVDHGVIDDAVRVTDQEAVDVAHWLLREEGLFVGSSSAMNVAGAIRAVMDAQEKKEEFDCVVTIICDGGQRHLSRFWNRDFIISWGLKWPGDDLDAWLKRLPSCLQGDGNR